MAQNTVAGACCSVVCGFVVFWSSCYWIWTSEHTYVAHLKVVMMMEDIDELGGLDTTCDGLVNGQLSIPTWSAKTAGVWQCPITEQYSFAQVGGRAAELVPLLPAGETLTGYSVASALEIFAWLEHKSCSGRSTGGSTRGGNKQKTVDDCTYSYTKSWTSEASVGSSLFCTGYTGPVTASDGGTAMCTAVTGVDFADLKQAAPDLSKATALNFGKLVAPESAIKFGKGWSLSNAALDLHAPGDGSSSSPIDQSLLTRTLVDLKVTARDEAVAREVTAKYVLFRRDGSTDNIGDFRLSYSIDKTTSKDHIVTVLAGVDSNGLLTGFRKDSKQHKSILLTASKALGAGTGHDANKLALHQFCDHETSAAEGNVNRARLFGWLLLFASMYLMTYPLQFMAASVPVCGDCLGGIVGAVLCCVNLLTATVFAAVIIAISWLAARPITGGLCLAGALAAGCGVAYLLKKHKTAAEPATEQQALQQEGSPAVGIAMTPVATPVVAMPVAQPQLMSVRCPEGSGPGAQVQIYTTTGQPMAVVVPPGVFAGQDFQVAI